MQVLADNSRYTFTMRVAFIPGCLVEAFYPQITALSESLLRSSGADVYIPSTGTCCGQPAWSSGHNKEAREMLTVVFNSAADSDYIVLPSASCTAMLRVFSGSLVEKRWDSVASRVYELSTFLVEILGFKLPHRSLHGQRIVVHHGCHARRELHSPGLIEKMFTDAGAEIVDWGAAADCCGFGGTFSVNTPSVSLAMADRKLDTLPECDWLVTADPGCLMQLSGRSQRRKLNFRIGHVADLLGQVSGVKP